MKTTLEIPDELYRDAENFAAAENRKLTDLVSEGLRLVIARPVASHGLSKRLTEAPVKIRSRRMIPALTNCQIAEILDGEA